MTLTIDLTPQEEADLTAAARQEGVDPPVLIKRLMTQLTPERPVEALSEEALRQEYHRPAYLELGNTLKDAQRHRLNLVREELDDREAGTPAVQALFQRLDKDDAKLDRLLHLLETRSPSSTDSANDDLHPPPRRAGTRRLPALP